MNTTTHLRPKTDFEGQLPHPERPDGRGRGRRFPDPQVTKIRGPKLIAIWVGLAAGAWCVAAGVGYGFYIVVQTLLP